MDNIEIQLRQILAKLCEENKWDSIANNILDNDEPAMDYVIEAMRRAVVFFKP